MIDWNDLAILGGGVTAAAVAYTATNYTNMKRIRLLEKASRVGTVNSHPLNNAQTQHIGDKETNYDFAGAKKLRYGGILMRNYADMRSTTGLCRTTPGLVLGVGAEEVSILKNRYDTFKPVYPGLEYLNGSEIAQVEPMVMKGRDESVPVSALKSLSYTMNYQRLAECFIEDAKAACPGFEISFNTSVHDVVPVSGGFRIITDVGEEIYARTVLFATGSYSLEFAHRMGYGEDLSLLNVQASFITSRKVIEGKVYCVQDLGNPWARIHADSDITDGNITRYGPTTKPVPFMEPRHYATFLDYLRQPIVSPKGALVLLDILIRNGLVGYVTKNMLYDVPGVGMRLFAREAQHIIPTLTHNDLHLRKNAGGIRPQIVNMKTWKLEMGDKTIVGTNAPIIFNTTPSPGASISLANAERDVTKFIGWLGKNYTFDQARFRATLGREEILRKAA